jgi:hypothetical protein
MTDRPASQQLAPSISTVDRLASQQLTVPQVNSQTVPHLNSDRLLSCGCRVDYQERLEPFRFDFAGVTPQTRGQVVPRLTARGLESACLSVSKSTHKTSTGVDGEDHAY